VYDRVVIGAGELVNGLWMGSVLIFIALAPGMIERCLDAIQLAMIARRMRPFPSLPRTPIRFEPPRWLAWAGVAIMLAAVLAYIT
jgi:hypothetical protein